MGDLLPSTTRQALDTLCSHHAQIASLLKALEHINEAGTRADLVSELFVELRVHSILEQQVLYPAVSARLAKEQVQRYGKEFYLLLSLMLELEQTDEADEQFGRNLAVIADRFAQHVEEHERSLFRDLEQERAVDFSALGKRLDLRKQELLEKMRSRMQPRHHQHDGSGFSGSPAVRHIRCA